MRAGTELDNLLEVAQFVKHEADDGRHPDAVRGWDKYKTYFTIDGKTIFEGEISIKLLERGDLFYDITKIKDTSIARTAGTADGSSSASNRDVSINSIRDNAENVKRNGQNSDKRFSLADTDSQGSKLSAEQREFFKDSKVVDDSGRLRVTYHGSPNSFYTFDRGRIGKGNDQFGAGFYFATSEETSRSYGDNVHKTYLNITKPIIINRTADGGDLFDVKITQKQAYEILKRHPLIYDPESSPLGDMFEEYWEVGAKDYMIREAAKNFNSIGLLDSDYIAYRDYPN